MVNIRGNTIAVRERVTIMIGVRVGEALGVILATDVTVVVGVRI